MSHCTAVNSLNNIRTINTTILVQNKHKLLTPVYPLIGVRYGEYSPQTLSNKKSQLIMFSDNINVIIRIDIR